MRGKLIIIEGTDASGKATQAKMLLEKLERKGIIVELFAFPRYETFFGKAIAKYLRGELGTKENLAPEFVALLYSLDRYHVKDELEAKLKQGINLVVDRYSSSNLAHQSARFSNRAEQDLFLHWLKQVESRLPKPDKKIFLNMPLDLAKNLMGKRDEEDNPEIQSIKDQHESDQKFLERTRDVYKRLLQNEDNWIQITCAKKENEQIVCKDKQAISEEVYDSVKHLFAR